MPRFSAVKTALSVVFDFWRDVVKKIFLILFNLCFIIGPAAALQLDLSIDEEIRKNYNPSKLEQENLPPLPKAGDRNGAGAGRRAGQPAAPGRRDLCRNGEQPGGPCAALCGQL